MTLIEFLVEIQIFLSKLETGKNTPTLMKRQFIRVKLNATTNFLKSFHVEIGDE